MKSADEVRAYWDHRAEEERGKPQATTNDVWLRELEVKTFEREIAAASGIPGSVLDIGCGDGSTVLRLARTMPDRTFYGLDYSANMIELAMTALDAEEDDVRSRVEFGVGDATQLGDSIGDRRFDVVTSDRCLINLTTADAQYGAIESIAGVLNDGGTYLAVENFVDGQNALNLAREALGLPPIAIRWHNLFFDESVFVKECRQWFSSVELVDFSSTYYLVTRVAYSALCMAEGSEPDYEHPLHQIATELPATGSFSPIKLARLRR